MTTTIDPTTGSGPAPGSEDEALALLAAPAEENLPPEKKKTGKPESRRCALASTGSQQVLNRFSTIAQVVEDLFAVGKA